MHRSLLLLIHRSCVMHAYVPNTGGIYKGVVPTMMKQGCNQAVRFTIYNTIKEHLLKDDPNREIKGWESMGIGTCNVCCTEQSYLTFALRY